MAGPDGAEVDSGAGTEGYKRVSYTRPDPSTDAIWSVKFSAQSMYIRIGEPLIPEFSEGYRGKIFIFGLPSTIMNTINGM